MFDRWSKSHTAIYLPAKGVGHPYSAEAVARAVSRHGYRRVVLKSDQEPALVALLAAAKDLCTCEVLLEHSPKGEPQAYGEAERAVQSIMGLARTLKEHITTATGQPIPAESPILAWLVNYAGSLLTLFNRGPDGKTPYERLRGRPWRVALPSFGEHVEFKRRTRRKLDTRWSSGVYLGVKEATMEKIVADTHGVYVVYSVRRKPADEQ